MLPPLFERDRGRSSIDRRARRPDLELGLLSEQRLAAREKRRRERYDQKLGHVLAPHPWSYPDDNSGMISRTSRIEAGSISTPIIVGSMHTTSGIEMITG